MNRSNLRKVEVYSSKRDVAEKPKVLFIGYFHQIVNKVFLDGSIPVALVELKDGTLQLVSLNDIRFIS